MNKRFFQNQFLLIFVTLILIVTGLTAQNTKNLWPATSSEKIVFSEVLYDSAIVGESYGEWIELYNPQYTAVNIGGWSIQDNTASFVIPNGTSIGPRNYIIIADSATYFSSLYGCTPNVIRNSLKLSNTGDYLILRNRSNSIVDQVAWGNGGNQISGWGSSSQPSANQSKSIIRFNPDVDTDSHNDWSSNCSPQPTCGTDGGNIPEINPPFGSFDTPLDGVVVAGSIAVTGWALDDSGVASVKIYLTEGNALTYIGSALFVEGARPDVAVAYPQYPGKTKAGWGYMMLTHFLPGAGNGVFVLSAIATDLTGKTTTLGTKTITVDNAHAVKPFGAIDTPAQGGTASGNSFINWGWVLTPLPNSIPTNGSAIHVWVDGLNLGNPTYNNYRADIATLFPGYVNSNGASGYFSLNTTGYTNGVHTIQWTATDSAGNTDGIGSRYFTIQNSNNDPFMEKSSASHSETGNSNHLDFISAIDSLAPIHIRHGYHNDTPLQKVEPEDNGIHHVYLKELELLEIHLGDFFTGSCGYMKQGDQLVPLPIGSTFDSDKGVFYWLPGPGFVGCYELVFIEMQSQGGKKKTIEVTILPKQY